MAAPVTADSILEPGPAGADAGFAGAGNPTPLAPSQVIAGTYRLRAVARWLRLGEGLYGLTVAPFDPVASPLSGYALPAIEITAPAQGGGEGGGPSVAILMGSGADTSWLGPEGGTVLVKAPAGGGTVMFTTYFPPEYDAVPLDIRIERHDAPGCDSPRYSPTA